MILLERLCTHKAFTIVKIMVMFLPLLLSVLHTIISYDSSR